ncbi:transposase [Streptomyces sp. NRRL S-146]|uniref:transposase n=1 Tax=Streptomyces sp. NRRL S-146 TaxID=1463884 RepID=UPI000B28BAC9|nr:transposase [Streptomyces sp. NRRL S-146]
MVKGRKRQLPSKLDPFKPYLAQRWTETDGKVTILDLHREITARGFRGHYSTVRDWARRDLPRQEGFTPAPPPPSVRQGDGWFTRHPAALSEEEKLHCKAVLDNCPELETAAELTSTFAEMLATLSGTRMTEWITEATNANLPGISSFAVGLHSDFDAVTAGLTTDWNSGPVEGAVNRIKMLKAADVRPCLLPAPSETRPARVTLRSRRGRQWRLTPLLTGVRARGVARVRGRRSGWLRRRSISGLLVRQASDRMRGKGRGRDGVVQAR